MPKPVLSSHRQLLATAAKTGVAYIISACLWILFSDKLVLLLIDNSEVSSVTLAQTLKGWFFVITTGVLFTIVLYRKLQQIYVTQQTLKEHGDNYKMLFENTPHPMWVYDPLTFAFLAVNKAAIHTYGYSREDFLAMKIHDILLPENENQYQATLSSHHSSDVVIRHHQRKDGAIRIVEVISHNLLFFGREVCLAQVHDITERTLAEENMRHSDEQYRNIVDTAHEGIWLVNSTGIITFVNRRMRELLGYTDEEMIGHSLFDFMDEKARQEAERHLEHSRKSNYHSHEFRFCDKNNQEVWTLVTTSLMNDGKGRFATTLGMVTDITERILAEQELRKSEKKFRHVLSNSIDVIYELNVEDPSYSYISPSSLRTLGISPDELVQHGIDRLLELVHEEDQALVAHYYQQLCNPLQQDELQLSVEYRISFNGDKHHWVSDTATIVANDKTSGIAIVGTIRDITSSKEAELVIHRMNAELERRVAERTMELEISNKELESFSYSVSHDLRAPLRSIDGFSKILLEDYIDTLDERGKNHLQRVRSASQRMGQLIDDLLTLSRVSRSNINFVTLNMSTIANSLIQKYRKTQPDRILQFLHSPDIMVHADANLMRILLDNLLNNAWKFSSRRDDSVIELGIINNKDEIVYFIRDNGVGFDMAYGHKLFGAFQRLHPISEFEGTGIGLATAHRIIRRHGGRIWAEGVVGQGATFYFTLAM